MPKNLKFDFIELILLLYGNDMLKLGVPPLISAWQSAKIAGTGSALAAKQRAIYAILLETFI